MRDLTEHPLNAGESEGRDPYNTAPRTLDPVSPNTTADQRAEAARILAGLTLELAP